MNDVLNKTVGANILIVDDKPLNVRLLEKMLSLSGYTNVQSTTDSREVLGLYQNNDFDLILLDIRMPHLDGFQVMEKLSGNIKDGYLPILVLTAHDDMETRLKALEAGAKDFISKPFDKTEVLSRITNILEVRFLYKERMRQNEILEAKVRERTSELQVRNEELQFTRQEIIRRLGRAETILEDAVQSLMQGVIIVDADCNILHMNKAFLDMYGIDPDEQLNLLNIKDVREAIGMGNPSLLVCNPDVSQMEMPITKLSDKKSIMHSYKPLSVGGGVWVDTDVSQIIDAEERNRKLEYDLLQSQKMESIGTLAGGIAHEINTPAQYISVNLKFLSDANEDLASIIRKWRIMTEKAQEHDVLAELAKKIETLCNEVDLDFILKEIPDAISQSRSGLAQVSKIVLAMKDFAHPGTADKSSYDINRAIETAITISHNQWKHVAEISMDLDQSLLMAECHPDQLNQVFLNLIVNASHAIESVEGRSEPGLIKLSTRLIDSQIVISVEDNGIGIPDTVINKIFDPFFTTKEVGRGTGQGLSIAYDIVVNKHAGTLQVASEIGKGTTFTIGLPVHESRVQKNPNIDLTERGDDIGTNP